MPGENLPPKLDGGIDISGADRQSKSTNHLTSPIPSNESFHTANQIHQITPPRQLPQPMTHRLHQPCHLTQSAPPTNHPTRSTPSTNHPTPPVESTNLNHTVNQIDQSLRNVNPTNKPPDNPHRPINHPTSPQAPPTKTTPTNLANQSPHAANQINQSRYTVNLTNRSPDEPHEPITP